MEAKHGNPAPESLKVPHFTFDPSLSEFNVTVSSHLAGHPGYDGIIVGAVVFCAGISDPGSEVPQAPCDRVLLIQRAAHDSMPSRWEIPGGACHRDEYLLHGLARELKEETGLALSSVVARVGDKFVFPTRKNRLMCKYTFEVEVTTADGDGAVAKADGAPAVTLSPEEHQAYLWATEAECRNRRKGDTELPFTNKDQIATILEAFQARSERRKPSQ